MKILIVCSDSCEISELNLAIIDNDNNINEYYVDSCKDERHSPSGSSDYKYEYINNDVKSWVKKCSPGNYTREESSLIAACLIQSSI